MDYLKVRNWDVWQSWRTGRGQPPWIKVHRRLMRNREWVSLSDAQKGQLVCIWLLAADDKGRIPDDPEMIQKLCYLETLPDLDLFTNKEFLEERRHDGAKPASSRRHDGANMTRQKRKEGNIASRVGTRGSERHLGGVTDQPLSPTPSSTRKGAETFSEPNGDGDITLGLAFFAEATKKRVRVERTAAAVRVLEYCLGLVDRPGGKAVWAAGVASSRKKCLAAISARLQDGYDEERLKRHAEFFVSLRRADGRFLAKYGNRPEYGDPFWCPGPTWKIWELFGPTRFDKYSDWSERDLITGADLEERWIGGVYQ